MPIPKKIHYCWFGYGEKSELVKRCIASWKQFCPDYKIIEWNEQNYDVKKNEYMHQAYQAQRWGFVSDFARLDIVYQHGGIYLDTDVELVKNLDTLLEADGFFGFERPVGPTDLYMVNSGQGFGACAGNAVVLKMLEAYKSRQFIRQDGTIDLTTCPTYNTEVLKTLGLQTDNTPQKICGVRIYPAEYFCPLSWRNKKCVITKNTYSIHHFNASWLSDREKRRRKSTRQVDYFIHIPNMLLKRILGESKYNSIKKKFK